MRRIAYDVLGTKEAGDEESNGSRVHKTVLIVCTLAYRRLACPYGRDACCWGKLVLGCVGSPVERKVGTSIKARPEPSVGMVHCWEMQELTDFNECLRLSSSPR